MTNRILRRNIVIPLAILFLSLSPISSSQSQSDESAILLYRPSSNVMRIEFTNADLERVRTEPGFVLRKLDEKGVKLCADRKRISNCIWVCCQDRVRTCNPVLITALEQIWGV
jgi:hypothetical protein